MHSHGSMCLTWFKNLVRHSITRDYYCLIYGNNYCNLKFLIRPKEKLENTKIIEKLHINDSEVQ